MSLKLLSTQPAAQAVDEPSLYSLCQEYIKTTRTIESLEKRLESLKKPIIKHLIEQGNIQHKDYLFKLGKRDSYRYSAETQQLAAKLRATENLERINGTAQVVRTTFFVRLENLEGKEVDNV